MLRQATDIDAASTETLHEMRQELLAAETFMGELTQREEARLQEIEGALDRKGEGVGVA